MHVQMNDPAEYAAAGRPVAAVDRLAVRLDPWADSAANRRVSTSRGRIFGAG